MKRRVGALLIYQCLVEKVHEVLPVKQSKNIHEYKTVNQLSSLDFGEIPD